MRLVVLLLSIVAFAFAQSNGYYVLGPLGPVTHGYRAQLTWSVQPAPAPIISPLDILLVYEAADRFHLKISDPNNKRWEIPTSLLPPPGIVNDGPPNVKFTYTQSPNSFVLTRRSDGTVIFNATLLHFEDQYLKFQIQTVPNPTLYGFGEHVDPLLLNNQQTYTMWAADDGTPTSINLYGVHPFYMQFLNGKAHGVFLRNSNGMDVALSPSGTITYNVIGGVLDFYVFDGPTPEQVIQQYQMVIGTPHMPPFWALGWHQCRWGYKNLEEVKAVVANYSAAQIPLDTIWTDIDYMDKFEDFSFDPVNFPASDMASFVDGLHQNGMQYVVIVDPGIHNRTGYAPFDQGVAQKIFMTRDDGVTPFIGRVWPGYTAFPDFLNPNTQNYWTNQISGFLKSVPIDGLWIDMNEISNFENGMDGFRDRSSSPVTSNIAKKDIKGSPLPPYVINNYGISAPLNFRTAGMDVLHDPQGAKILEYNAHSLYGFTESIATKNALESIQNRRSFVLSRSTFAGSGHHAAHWLGDNNSDFYSMTMSIAGLLNMNIFGIPLVGPDTCGFNGDTTEELCARWTALGAFYPFARNHNAINQIPQEPYRWASVAAIARNVLSARYAILPYLYTLFYNANQNGGTVARPLSFNFPADTNTYPIDKQFMWGSCLLISPVLTQGATSVNAYIPPSSNWYDFWNLTALPSSVSGWVDFDAPLNYIPVHIRGGCILPFQAPALTTSAARKNPKGIMVAPDSNGQGSGSLFWDDGLSLQVGAEATLVQYTLTPGMLVANVTQATQTTSVPSLEIVYVMGVTKNPSTVTANGHAVQFLWTPSTELLMITNINLPITTSVTVAWQ